MKKIFILFALIGFLVISCSKEEENNTPTVCLKNPHSVAKIISEKEFNEISTTHYDIKDVKFVKDSLQITIAAGGCGGRTWQVELFSHNSFYAIFPLQRAVKVRLINNELCKAFIHRTFSFDLTPLQIKGQNSVPLNIEGWNKQIIYKYK